MPLQPDEKLVEQAAAALKQAILQLPDDARWACAGELTQDELNTLARAVIAVRDPLPQDLEQRAVELLAEAYEDLGSPESAVSLRASVGIFNPHPVAIRAITKALASSSVPEDLIQWQDVFDEARYHCAQAQTYIAQYEATPAQLTSARYHLKKLADVISAKQVSV